MRPVARRDVPRTNGALSKPTPAIATDHALGADPWAAAVSPAGSAFEVGTTRGRIEREIQPLIIHPVDDAGGRASLSVFHPRAALTRPGGAMTHQRGGERPGWRDRSGISRTADRANSPDRLCRSQIKIVRPIVADHDRCPAGGDQAQR